MSKLDGVHPMLIEKVKRLMYACAELGHPLVVTDGVRTEQQQWALYQQGRDKPGKIVTYADGITVKSNHQRKADGFGHAVDVAFIINERPSWAEQHPWYLLGPLAKCLGLSWGGDWKRPDRPHLEL